MAIEVTTTPDSSGRREPPARRTPLFTLHGSRVTARDRRFFTEQLALLLSTGIDLHSSLVALRDQAISPAMRGLVAALIEDVGEGRQFSDALGRHPEVFSRTYVNLIGASEDGGYIHEVLEQLLDMEDKREKLSRTLFSALSYPVFLLVFALAVVVFVLVVVFPKFADLFAGIADELPATTHFLMQTSHLLLAQWPWLIGGAAAASQAAALWSQSDHGRLRIDRFKLHAPLVSGIFRRLYLLQSLRVLGLSLGHGVGIIDALHATRDVVSNREFTRVLDTVEHDVKGGEGVAAGFEGIPFIPPVVVQMIRTGEETGNLPRVLGRLADHYERELAGKLDTLSRLAEPVMLLVMGAVVGVIVSSLILPIFKLSRAVG